MKHKKKKIYNNDYESIIAKMEVFLVTTESNLKNELSHLENAILMQSKSLNIIAESESEKKKLQKYDQEITICQSS